MLICSGEVVYDDEAGLPREPRRTDRASVAQLRHWLCSKGDRLTDAEFDDLISCCSVDSDGTFTYEAFKSMRCWRPVRPPPAVLPRGRPASLTDLPPSTSHDATGY